MSEIERWLEGLGMSAYAPAFAAQHIEFDLVADLRDDDLKQLGVEALGHRKRLLRAIAALPGGGAPVLAAPAIRPTAASPVARDAERRQLTVMFCDLVGSTVLSRELDPEDLQRLLLDYHASVAAAVAPYAGHVARFLGDGVLVYFGFPQAHEDDATRAVRAALSVLVGLRQRSGDRVLQARIGIATGLVVVGEVGAGTAGAEHAASGETPNLAARLQARAQPGEIVLSAETRELLGQAFALESLGRLDLKGFVAPIEAWRVAGEHQVATRFEAQHMQGLGAFIGRDSEIALLLERWALAREGEGQAVLLSGEAGLGKSRICQSLRERLAEESVTTVLLQCSPYFSGSALYPVVQHLERTAGMAAADAPEVRVNWLGQLARALPSASLGCLLRLMGLPDDGRSLPNGTSPQEERAHTLEALVELLHRLAEQQPVLLLVEDAHWIDPTTDELLGQLVQQLREQRVLMLVTCRPQYTPAWGGAAPLTRHSLSRLSQRQCTALVGAVAGKPLPAEVLAEIIRKTDGIPLFVEELTKTVVQSGFMEDTPSGYRLCGPLPQLAIPTTLQDSLMARLDRLAPAKEVAQVGAVIGREFGHRLIVQILDAMPPSKLDDALADLVSSELVFRRGTAPDAIYSFKHALVRDTAYNSMLKSQRVIRHRQIAVALEQEVAGSAPNHELLAYHHQEGGNAAEALRFWRAAGDQASARSAMREAVTHYQAGLSLLESVKAVEHCADLELALRIRLGNALAQTEGTASPRLFENFARARDLAVSLDRPNEHVQACGGMSGGLNAAGRFSEGIALLEQFGAAELERMKQASRVNRLARLAYPRMLRGELTQAQSLLLEARHELQDVRSEERQALGGGDPEVAILMWLTSNLAWQGLLSSADACAREGLDIAERRRHMFSRTWALQRTGTMSAMKGNWIDAATHSAEALELAERYSLKARGAGAKSQLGAALVATAQLDEGIRLLREGYAEYTIYGGRFFSTGLATNAAEVLLDSGRRDESTEFILAGEKTMNETDEKCQAAPLLSLRGRLAELDGDGVAAAAAYGNAIEIAEKQGALLFALRAATLLAQFLQSHGRAGEADAVLRPIYARFTEGFDWPDLVRARLVLKDGG